jgi:hypothetical protein
MSLFLVHMLVAVDILHLVQVAMEQADANS